jgi:hypothetical protein
MDLPTDIHEYLFSLARFRLRDIINLTVVSKRLRMISLKEQYWHVIIDTRKILYDFVRQVFTSTTSYPSNRIQQMYSIDLFHCTNKILDIYILNQQNFVKFYNHFPDYQICHIGHPGLDIDNCHGSLKTVHILDLFSHIDVIAYLSHNYLVNNCTITEIIMRHNTIDCEFLIKNYPHLEKLEIYSLENIKQLKQINLIYLNIGIRTRINEIIPCLPLTIKSLIIQNGDYIPIMLNQLPHLNYLSIHLTSLELSTTLNVNTIHYVIDRRNIDVKINIPNVKNIIIVCNYISGISIPSLQLVSQNAVTCQIYNIKISNFSSVLPNCPQIMMRDHISESKYDSRVFN